MFASSAKAPSTYAQGRAHSKNGVRPRLEWERVIDWIHRESMFEIFGYGWSSCITSVLHRLGGRGIRQCTVPGMSNVDSVDRIDICILHVGQIRGM